MTLTPEIQAELRRPFTPEAVGFRLDGKKPAKKVRCVVYIDARLARERLNDVDPCWTAEYEHIGALPSDPLGVGVFLPVRCKLTVCGVTRIGVGQAANAKASANVVKSAYSDALKRAAVEFGVGAYLYALKTFFVSESGYWTMQRNGETVVGGLDRKGTLELRDQYKRLIEHDMFKARFGEPTEYGTLEDDERGQVDDDEAAIDPGQLTLDAPAQPAQKLTAVRR